MARRTEPAFCAQCGAELGARRKFYCTPVCFRLARGERKQDQRHASGSPWRTLRTIDDYHTLCPDCGVVKINTEYGSDQSRYDGLSYRCRPCTNAHRKRVGIKNPTAVKASHRKNQLQKYNLTPDDYEALSAAQNQRCAICSTVVERLHVDHDHATGRVRGLLCQPCNIGLGNFQDQVVHLLAAADYLFQGQDVLQTMELTQ